MIIIKAIIQQQKCQFLPSSLSSSLSLSLSSSSSSIVRRKKTTTAFFSCHQLFYKKVNNYNRRTTTGIVFNRIYNNYNNNNKKKNVTRRKLSSYSTSVDNSNNDDCILSSSSSSPSQIKTNNNQNNKHDKKIINGTIISKSIRKKLTNELKELQKIYPTKKPGLAVFLVGDNTDSHTYVKMKQRACNEIGIENFGDTHLPHDISEKELITVIQTANNDPEIHGILIQLPLPNHINTKHVIEHIHPDKDVDGLHSSNVAKLSQSSSRAQLYKDEYYHIACTPQGCIDLIESIPIDDSAVDNTTATTNNNNDNNNVNNNNVNNKYYSIEGKNAVVIGRSNIVGTPTALLLLQRNATVTIVHSKTINPEQIVRHADIVVVAIGSAKFVKSHWIKEGAIVIDVGINSQPDANKKKGYRLVGDVDFNNVIHVAGYITKVPGGVGPMTVAYLMKNTMEAFKKSLSM